MAYRKRSRNFRGKSYRYGYGASFKRGVGASVGGYGVNLSTPFLAGAGVGALTDIDNNIPATIKVAVACAPIRGKGIGAIKAFAQGLLIGDLIQHYTGFSGLATNTGQSSGIWSNTV